MTTEFGAAATLEVTVDERSLAEVRAEVEDAVGDIPLGGPTGAAGMVGGGGAATDGGQAVGATLAGELADQTDLLEEIRDELDGGAALAAGGGGGGGLGGLLGTVVGGGGGALAGGGLGSLGGLAGLAAGGAVAAAGIASRGFANTNALTEDGLVGKLFGEQNPEGGDRLTTPNPSGAAPGLVTAVTEAAVGGVSSAATDAGDALVDAASQFGSEVDRLNEVIPQPSESAGNAQAPGFVPGGRGAGLGGGGASEVQPPGFVPGGRGSADVSDGARGAANRREFRTALSQARGNTGARSARERARFRQALDQSSSTSAAEKRPPQVQVNITNELRNELNINNQRDLQRLLRDPQAYVREVLRGEVRGSGGGR